MPHKKVGISKGTVITLYNYNLHHLSSHDLVGNCFQISGVVHVGINECRIKEEEKYWSRGAAEVWDRTQNRYLLSLMELNKAPNFTLIGGEHTS